MAFLIPPSLHNYQLNLSAGYDLETLSPFPNYPHMPRIVP